MHFRFKQTMDGEVLSKHSHRQLSPRQFFLPIAVMLHRIAVNRFVLASVNSEVRLSVAVQIQLANATRSATGSLKIPVVTLLPCHSTSRGIPTFNEIIFIFRTYAVTLRRTTKFAEGSHLSGSAPEHPQAGIVQMPVR